MTERPVPEPSTVGPEPAPGRSVERVLHNASLTLATRGATSLLRLIRNVILARLLGPFERGALNALFALIETLIYVSGFGLAMAAQKEAANAEDPHRGNLVLLVLATAIGLIIAALTFGALSTGVLFAGAEQALKPFAAMFAIMAFMMFMRNIGHAQLVGGERIARSNAFRLVEAVLLIVLVLILVIVFEKDLTAVSFGFFVGYGVVFFLVYRSLFAGGVTRPEGRWPRALTQVMKSGLRSYPDDVALSVVFRADLLFLAALKGAETAAFYAIALVGTEVLATVSESVASAAAKSLLTQREGERAPDKQTFAMVRLTLYGAVPGAVILSLLSPLWVGGLFGQDYLPATVAVPWLAAAVAAASVLAFIRLSLIGKGYPGLVSLVASVSAVASLLLNLLLIPPFGMVGAAIASLITYVGMTGVNAVHLAYRAKISPIRYFWDPETDRAIARAVIARMKGMREGRQSPQET